MDENTVRLWLKDHQDVAEKLVQQQAEAFQLQLDTLRTELQATRGLLQIRQGGGEQPPQSIPADQHLRIVIFNLEGATTEWFRWMFDHYLGQKEQNIKEKANTTLTLSSEEASSVVKGLLDASEDTLISLRRPVDEVRGKFAKFSGDKGCVEKVLSATKLPEGGNCHSTYFSYHLEGKVIFEGVRNVTPWAADGGRRKRVKCYVQGSGRRKRKKVIGRGSERRVLNVAVSKSVDDNSWLRNNIFRTKCTSKGKIYDMIIDRGSCENVVSIYMVEKLGMKTEDHPEPYQLTWLKKRNTVKQFDRKTKHEGFQNTYSFKKDGVNITLVPFDSRQTLAEGFNLFMKKTDFKGLMKTTPDVFTLVIVEENQIISATPLQVQPLLKEFADVIADDIPPGLPAMRDIQHCIDFIPGSSILNRLAYRMNPKEFAEL
ncbi:hypothetical protein Tco_1568733 [Tanacetum coccineum]